MSQIAQSKENPEFQKMMFEMFSEGFQEPAAVDKQPMEQVPSATKKGGKTPRGMNTAVSNMINKSPSDTMIYKPAFRRVAGETNEVIDKISHFIESICIEPPKNVAEIPKAGPSGGRMAKNDEITAFDAAKHVVVDAEQFKAQIQSLKGKYLDIELAKLPSNHLDDDDDDFDSLIVQ